MRVGAMTYGKLVALMLDGELNNAELAELTGLHPTTVSEYAKALRRAGAAFVCRIDPDTIGRMAVKVYEIGVGKDVKRKPLTANQRSQNRRERNAIRLKYAAVGQDPLSQSVKTV